jgi:hypothetical protein
VLLKYDQFLPIQEKLRSVGQFRKLMISLHICYIGLNAERNNVRKLGTGTVCIWFAVFWFRRDKDNNGASLLSLCGFAYSLTLGSSSDSNHFFCTSLFFAMTFAEMVDACPLKSSSLSCNAISTVS